MRFLGPLGPLRPFSRHRAAELMDDPALAAAEHVAALAGLERINRISGTARAIWPRIKHIAREVDRPLRVLDIATGAGDLPQALERIGRGAGIPIEAAGCDISPVALDYAGRRSGNGRKRFFKLDPLNEPLPPGFDIIVCALFVHHLDDADAVRLIRAMKDAAGRAVIIDDLRRDTIGLALAWAGTRLMTRSRVVHVDAIRSVRAAFTIGEASELARNAGLDGAAITPHWPRRWLMEWRKP